jgi:PAS domain S-box-containing protein
MGGKKINVLIVGAGRGGAALINMLKDDELVNILGVVDADPEAPGIKLAKELGITTANNWKGFINDSSLDEIVDVSGSNDVHYQLLKDKPEDVELMGGPIARIIWLLFEERQKINEAIKQSKDFLQSIFESLPHPFYVVDVKDYTVQMANSAAGFARWPQAKKCYMLSHARNKPCDTKEHPCPLEELKRTKKPVIVEHLHHDSRGRDLNYEVHAYPIFDKDGNVSKMIEYSFDISQRKRDESQIRRLSAAIEQSPSTVIITDTAGNIEYVNPKFTQLTGYTSNEVRGKNPRILKSGKHSREVYKELWKIITSGGEWRGELFNKKKDGGMYWEAASISPIRDSHGNIVNFLKVAEDITERKEAERRLKEAKDELEIQAWGLKKTNQAIKLLYKELEKTNRELQKLDQLKSDFVSTVSHELRTPLSIMREGISLVLDEIPGKINDQQKKFLNIAQANIDRLSRVINDLLDISKLEAGRIELRKQSVNINTLVEHVVSSYDSKALQKGIELKLSLPQEALNVYGDADRITQVFTNLIYNAIKFTREGFIEVAVRDRNDEVECSVIDTGIGISKDNLSKVFGKFQQFGRTQGAGEQGTGLGLAITKGIVELHKGKIWVDSDLGKGTKFIFTLPKYSSELVLKENLDKAISEANKDGRKVSLILASPEGPKDKIGSILKDLQSTFQDNLRNREDIALEIPEKIAVILCDCNKECALRLIGRLEKTIDDYLAGHNLSGVFKFRLDCVTYPDDAKSSEQLIQEIIKKQAS